MGKKYQVAAIPFRRTPSGAVEVLLVTSRRTRRWVVPKGWPWRKTGDHDAAAGEAWEEAGIKGRVRKKSIGTFEYPKLDARKPGLLEVKAFLLEVAEEAAKWPEAKERRRKWFRPRRAALLVAEPGLKKLLRDLSRGIGPVKRKSK